MTYKQPDPKPDGSARRSEAERRRNKAASDSRKAVATVPNGESVRFENVWPTNFTKGLPHNVYGVVDPHAFKAFFKAINQPDLDFDVPLGPQVTTSGSVEKYLTGHPVSHTAWKSRFWESPISGHNYDLQGPDVGSVGMAPAPALGSDELAAEMAEDYAMALLRDRSFEDMRNGLHETPSIIETMNKMPWFSKTGQPMDEFDGPLSPFSNKRRKARALHTDELDVMSLFRGSSFGCQVGPYVSQFLLQGNKSRSGSTGRDGDTRDTGLKLKQTSMVPDTFAEEKGAVKESKASDGYIIYGPQRVDQRVDAQKAGVDYLTDWAEWLDVQNGARVANIDDFAKQLRFIATPRDLATYVHFDALYQAYLNACLLMLAWGAKTDAGLPEPNKQGTRDAFATFGGPHILTLVTETATRSLKAVRRQKYNFHNRARPEAVGALAALCANGHESELGSEVEPYLLAHLKKLRAAQDSSGESILDMIAAKNGAGQKHFHHLAHDYALPDIKENLMLPMAFPEGSPMHPAYGAGHATVAGSCVTVLKAFFEMFKKDRDGNPTWEPLPLSKVGISNPDEEGPVEQVFVASNDGLSLEDYKGDETVDDLTLMGELNKLAANISIGRNMAGVHYYSDYFDSVRMGERIAVGMLVEQMSTYVEPLHMRFLSFDDDQIEIHGDGKGGSSLRITRMGAPVDVDNWYNRHVDPAAATS